MHKMKPLTENTAAKDHLAFRMSNEGLITLRGKRRERHVYSVDMKRWSLLRHIPTIDHEVSTTDAVSLGYLCYLYALRLANTKTMRRLTTVHKDVVTQTKDNMFMSDDLLKYKMATLRCVVNKCTPNHYKEIESHFKACDLNSEDAIFYHLLYHNHDLEKFVAIMATIEDAKFTLDIHTLRDEIERHPRALKTFNKTSSFYAYRKLRFIADGNRLSCEDLQQDLKERATQAYYWVRPFYSVEHAINYANRSMHGYMSVLIAYYNHPDRRRINEDVGYGSENICREYDDGEMVHGKQYYAQEDATIAYIDWARSVGVSP